MATYSFLDNSATIAGIGGVFNLAGDGAGNAEEGISIEMTEDKNTMTIGADGSVMHSLHAGKSGTVTVRLLKTSPVNQKLSLMYAVQTASSALHGNNVISVRNTATGDAVTCQQVAFAKYANLTYAKDGGMNEWTFHAGKIDGYLGAP